MSRLLELLRAVLDAFRRPPAPDPPPAPQPPPPAPAPDPAAVRARLLVLHNDARAQAGVPPLAVDAHLEAAAQQHAGRVASGQEQEHDHWLDEDRSAGYLGGTAGQNLAGPGYATPDAAFAGWLGSVPHRANILAPGYTLVGFGASGTTYVANFGASS